MTMIERVVPGFLPSTAGFHFANRWPSGPALRLAAQIPGPVPFALELRIGDTANGLCGGMALATIDRWLRRELPPADREPPPEGSALFREIVARQVDSLELGLAILRFYRAGAASARVRAGIVVRKAWPTIRREIDAGRPAGLGFIHVASADPRRLVGDHQVVAYGYELDTLARALALRIYDPNHPDDDAVRLRLTLAGPRGPVDYAYIAGEAPVFGLVPLGRR
jgi:hypothetical protein